MSRCGQTEFSPDLWVAVVADATLLTPLILARNKRTWLAHLVVWLCGF